jgi:hypothetical protein
VALPTAPPVPGAEALARAAAPPSPRAEPKDRPGAGRAEPAQPRPGKPALPEPAGPFLGAERPKKPRPPAASGAGATATPASGEQRRLRSAGPAPAGHLATPTPASPLAGLPTATAAAAAHAQPHGIVPSPVAAAPAPFRSPAPPAAAPGAKGRTRRFSRDWWAPLLVAIGLILILLIGIFTALNAETVARRAEGLFPFQPKATIMIASNAPEAAPFEGKARQWRI